MALNPLHPNNLYILVRVQSNSTRYAECFTTEDAALERAEEYLSATVDSPQAGRIVECLIGQIWDGMHYKRVQPFDRRPIHYRSDVSYDLEDDDAS